MADLQENSEAPEEVALAMGDLGIWYLAFHDPGPAEIAFGNAARLDADGGRWLYLKGHAAIVRGELVEAQNLFREVVSRKPVYVPALVWLGEIALERGELEEAAAFFRSALELQNSCSRARAGLGLVALEMEDPHVAIDHLERAIAAHPGYRGLDFSLGVAYRRTGNVLQADLLMRRGQRDRRLRMPMHDPWLEDVRKLRSTTAQSSRRRAEKLVRQGRYQEAEPLLRAVLEADPDNPTDRINLAQCLRNLRLFGEAEELLQSVLDDDGDHPGAHRHLGDLNARLGDPEAAERHLRHAVAVSPDYDEARLHLGWLLQRLGRHAEANEEFVRLSRVGRSGPSAIRGVVETALKMGRMAEARAALGQGVVRFPDDRQLTRLHVRVLACARNEHDSSLAQTIAAEQLGKSDAPLDLAARAMAASSVGQVREATALQQAALEALEEREIWLRSFFRCRLGDYRRGVTCSSIFLPGEGMGPWRGLGDSEAGAGIDRPDCRP